MCIPDLSRHALRRAALTQRGVVGRPVQGAVADRRGLGHAAQLCRWTRDVNPGQPSCNKVGARPSVARIEN